jgi:DNA-binding transcriptional regulator YiaG
MSITVKTRLNNTNKLYMTILNEIYSELLQSNKWLSPREIREVRKLYRLTQVNFAKLLHISYHTYKNWEIGHRLPSSPAMALLYIARDHQELFLKERDKILSTISNL